MANKKSILQEADSLVNGDRLEEYGPVYENLTKVGAMAQLMLSENEKLQLESAIISPTIITKIMIAMKLSRQSTFQKRDNLVDLAGYTELLDTIISEEEDREIAAMAELEKAKVKAKKTSARKKKGRK